jgi:hypothetical protein
MEGETEVCRAPAGVEWKEPFLLKVSGGGDNVAKSVRRPRLTFKDRYGTH